VGPASMQTRIALCGVCLLMALAACSGGNSGEAADGATASPTPTFDVEGRKPVAWKLVGPKPAPSDTEIEVVAAWIECTSGSEPEDPLPAVAYDETTISVTIWAALPSGNAFDCQGNPSVTVTVDLTEAVGDRTIVQGPETPY
jgi:hypothetical protein